MNLSENPSSVDFSIMVENVRNQCPLVHNITNYVTVNDCANMLLAAKASPIMADAIEEVEDIVSIASALNINMGTLNSRTVESMKAALRKANETGTPVILDPVGAGASAFRTQTAFDLLESGKFAVIKGNISEIKTLASRSGHTRGVDAALDDLQEDPLAVAEKEAAKLAEEQKCVVVVTGKTDVITNGIQTCYVQNGHSDMSTITGTGCMLNALLAAYVGANPDHPLEAATAATAAMGIAGELAASRMKPADGNGSYRMYLLDAMSGMTPEVWRTHARVTKKTESSVHHPADCSAWMKVYAVSDRSWARDHQDFLNQVEQALESGITVLQLREKHLDDEDFLAEAREVQKLCRKYQVPLIINDNVDVAIQIQADGIHVGQSDMEAGALRKKVGNDMIIGVSVHTPLQALKAREDGADYLGAGAAFATSTKADVEVMEPAVMKAICDSTDLPVVAIGGITAANIPQLHHRNLDGVAVVSAIFAAPDIPKAVAELSRQADLLLDTKA